MRMMRGDLAVELLLRLANFWNISVPPNDWRDCPMEKRLAGPSLALDWLFTFYQPGRSILDQWSDTTFMVLILIVALFGIVLGIVMLVS